MRYLITGGAGLIGSHLADLLSAEPGAAVVVLDDFSRGRRDNLAGALGTNALRIVDGDIRNRALVDQCMKGVDIVFHLAALRITQCAEEPRRAIEVLVNGTFEVVEAAMAASVRKVVIASSASVYGMAESFPTSERHHPHDNDTLYGAAKLFGEGLFRSLGATRGLDWVALRYFNVYGPRMDTTGVYTEVLVRWMDQIAAGRPPVIFGDGMQTMDFVEVSDVARANILAATTCTRDRVFNIASGVETSLLELARLLLRVMGSSLEVTHAPERRVNAVRRRLADVERARAELGFEAKVTLDQGLHRLVEWWRTTR